MINEKANKIPDKEVFNRPRLVLPSGCYDWLALGNDFSLARWAVNSMTNPHVPPVPRPRPRVEISPFQERVLLLLAQGRNTAEIAQDLRYSERTVKNHICQMNIKLGARNRTHMIALAYQEGLLICP